MATTPRHGYLVWEEGATQPNVVYNDLIDKLDVEVSLSVISDSTDAQPVSPTEGDTYIITGAATGTDWSTYNQYDIAIYRDASWTSFAPLTGQGVWVVDITSYKVFNGTNYTTITGGAFIVAAGTPVDNQVAVWTAADTVEGDGDFTWSGTELGVTGNFRLVGHIVDTNSLELLKFTSVASAVNELTITNAVTTEAPSLAATGDDTNIDVKLIPKGTGNVVLGTYTLNADQTVGATEDGYALAYNHSAGEIELTQLGTKYVGVNDQTGTAYTLVAGDAGYLVTMNNANSNTLTIPANASVAFPVGTVIDVAQLGVGQTTIAITTDTLNAAGGNNINAQFEMVSLVKIASTTWIMVGGVA